MGITVEIESVGHSDVRVYVTGDKDGQVTILPPKGWEAVGSEWDGESGERREHFCPSPAPCVEP